MTSQCTMASQTRQKRAPRTRMGTGRFGEQRCDCEFAIAQISSSKEPAAEPPDESDEFERVRYLAAMSIRYGYGDN